jgi:hypothetical protein
MKFVVLILCALIASLKAGSPAECVLPGKVALTFEDSMRE